MSNYHILDGRPNGNRYRVVMHFSVPDANNQAGMNWRLALIQFLGGSQPSVVPFIDAGEQDQLNTGELFEYIVPDYYTHPGEDLAAKLAALDARHTVLQVQIQGIIQAQLEFWGYNRNIL